MRCEDRAEVRKGLRHIADRDPPSDVESLVEEPDVVRERHQALEERASVLRSCCARSQPTNRAARRALSADARRRSREAVAPGYRPVLERYRVRVETSIDDAFTRPEDRAAARRLPPATGRDGSRAAANAFSDNG